MCAVCRYWQLCYMRRCVAGSLGDETCLRGADNFIGVCLALVAAVNGLLTLRQLNIYYSFGF